MAESSAVSTLNSRGRPIGGLAFLSFIPTSILGACPAKVDAYYPYQSIQKYHRQGNNSTRPTGQKRKEPCRRNSAEKSQSSPAPPRELAHRSQYALPRKGQRWSSTIPPAGRGQTALLA